MNWLGKQLEEHHLFRRLVIVFFLFMYMEVTRESFNYAYFAAERGMSAGDTVLVLGSLQTLMTALMGYAFKIYSTSRSKE
ncbi:MAG: hypothetical protein K2Q14_07055 [Gammaproteobacteria bacterium]|nr:hypothetical protein [Nitrosomonas sp.]MBY0545286.1 hypothetical protein [Gammaproteobacteria bacterium]